MFPNPRLASDSPLAQTEISFFSEEEVCDNQAYIDRRENGNIVVSFLFRSIVQSYSGTMPRHAGACCVDPRLEVSKEKERCAEMRCFALELKKETKAG